MSVVQAVVLGVVQGLTEFIPISSSGHLVLVPEVLGWREPGLAFDVLLHLASLLALLVYFSGDLVDLGRGTIGGDRDSRRLVGLLAIGTIPAAVAGLAFGDFFEEQFTNAGAAALQLVATAVILVAAERLLARHERKRSEIGRPLRHLPDLRIGDAALAGTAQALSILPGISRSGSTIGAGLALAVARDDAARFAFLLAIPALAGAAAVEIPDLRGTSLGLGSAIAGFSASLVVSYASVAALLKFLRTNTLYPFAAYCLVAGLVFYALV